MLKALALLAWLLLPPFSHPARYALRRAGIEKLRII
jgi:hypothetical protein